MSNDIKINVKADADLGGINSALAEAAKSAEVLSKSMSGGVLNIDTDKFTQQINQTTAALKVLHEKIQEKKQLGISTDTAEAQLKEFTQKKSDATRVLIGSQPGSGGKTPLEQSHQREQREIEKTQQAAKKLYREISTAEADALNRSKHNLDTGRSPYAAYSKHHASFADLMQDGTPGAREATKRVMQNAGLHEAGVRPKAGATLQYGGKLAGAAIGMAGGMVAGGAGGDGMATAGSALGGMVGSVFGPVGSMIGGALGGLAGGVVGGGLGDAKDEAIGITDLRHSLGATTTDFTLLREAARAAASGMGMTSIESTRLAKQFSHNANTQNKDAGSLAAEIHLASGLSRSLGLDPSQGVEAMSTLRNTRVTTDEAGSRKMAMTIADAISKGGMSSKGDEVLSAIANFAQATARSSLQTPNVTGYADYMSRMVSMKTPGLDVQGSASLLGKADAGIRSHSDLASEVFKLGAFTKAFGNNFTAPDMDLYTSQGAFGTAEGVADELLADKTITPERRQSALDVKNSKSAKRPIQDIMMDQLGTIAPRGSALYEQAGAHLFGMEHNEFRKYQQTYNNTEGGSAGMKSQLDAMGINTGKLDSKKFMHMGALLGSNKDELKAEGEKLISGNGYSKGLNETQKKELQSLIDNGSEGDLKKKVIQLQEGRELTDIGTATRDNTAEIKQKIIDLSSALLPAVNSVRDAILLGNSSSPEKLAAAQKEWELESRNKGIENEANQKFPSGGWAGDENYDKRRDFIAKKKKEASDAYDAQHAPKLADVKTDDDGRPRSIISGGGHIATGKIYRPGTPNDAKQDMLENGQALSGAMGVKLSDEEEAQLRAVSGGDSKKEKFLRTLLQIENRGKGKADNYAVSKAGAKGAFQFMPKTAEGYKGKAGLSSYDLSSFSDSAKLAGAYYDDISSRYRGDEAKMLADYNGGPKMAKNAGATGNAENDHYVRMGKGLLADSAADKVPARDVAMIKASAQQEPAHDSQTVTIIVKSAENKFAPEKVKVSIAARSRATGVMSGVM